MTILFAGGEMTAFSPSDSSVSESTTFGAWNSSFARNYIDCGLSVSYCETPAFAAATDFWVHVEMALQAMASSTAGTRMILLDGSGVPRIRMSYTGTTSTLKVDYYNGSWVNAGSAVVPIGETTEQTLDLHVVCNSASGSLTLYIAGTGRITATGLDLSATTSITKAQFTSALTGITSRTFISQVVIADVATVGWRLISRYPNGVGADTAFTGTYTDVDESAYSDADFILSATADQVETYTQTGPAISGYVVRAVVVSGRVRRGSSGPQKCRMALRSAGTTYFSGSDITLGLGYAPVQTVWETNPATGAAWVSTAVDALQLGIKSIA